MYSRLFIFKSRVCYMVVLLLHSILFGLTADISSGPIRRYSKSMLGICESLHGIKIYIWSKNTKGCYIIGSYVMIALSHFILDSSRNVGRWKKRFMLIVWRTITKWWSLISLNYKNYYLMRRSHLTGWVTIICQLVVVKLYFRPRGVQS